MSDVNYFFGRLTFIATYDNKEDFVAKGLNNHSKISKRDFLYGFFDVEQIEIAGQSIIRGYLVKYKKVVEEEKVNERKGKIEVASIDDGIVGKSQFFIDNENSLIAFHEASSQISKDQFVRLFKEVFESSFEGFFVEVGIHLINDGVSFLKELKSFEIVSKVTISLVPSNPHFGEEWKEIDKLMKEENLTNYKQVYENKRGGSVVVDKKIESGIYMSEDGYGVADATGLKNGKTTTISTKKSKNVQHAKAPKNSAPENIMYALRDKWNMIASKFKKS